MKSIKNTGIEIGDVLLLSDGRLVRMASELKSRSTLDLGYFMLQFMDQNGETFQEDDGALDVEANLGQTPEILASFYTARSIHLRMNDAKLFG